MVPHFMLINDIFLAILVAALWGFSFVVMKLGLQHIPPALLCCARFFFTCFPAIFFVKRPTIPWYFIVSYGLFMFAIKFTLLFISIKIGIGSGLASLLVQLQVFFTLFLVSVFLKEQITKQQMIGTFISFSGLVLVGMHLGVEINIGGFSLIILSALSWAIANLISKKIRVQDCFALIVWASLFAWPILFLISYRFEGGNIILYSLQHISLTEWTAILYMAYPVTLFGFYAWSKLLSFYPTSKIIPFALLIPLFGLYGSVIFLNEILETWKIMTAFLIILGLSITLIEKKTNKIY